VASPSHFEFSITADQQCIPEEYYTRTTYCTNELHVKALMAGVLLIKDLSLSDGLSVIDRVILEKAFDDLFGNVGVTATIRSEDSADGLLVSFTLGIPVTYYGYTNTYFNAPHLTYLKAHDDLLSSFRSDLFSSMLDSQIHSHFNHETSHLLESQIGQCHLSAHGSISLLSITESGWENEVPFTANINPVTFYPEEVDEGTPFYSFQTGVPTFLIVVMVGGTVMFFIYSSKKRQPAVMSSRKTEPSSPSSSSSSSSYFKKHFKYIYDFNQVRSPSSRPNYAVIRAPSDEEGAPDEQRQRKFSVSSLYPSPSTSCVDLSHSFLL
jgi:hypothetical protein